jgi:cation transport ATPase
MLAHTRLFCALPALNRHNAVLLRSLTFPGESLPISKAPGAAVISGTVNGTGALLVSATRVGAQTTLASIARLVAASQASKAPVQVSEVTAGRTADGWAGGFFMFCCAQ